MEAKLITKSDSNRADRKSLVDSQADSFRSRTGRKFFEFLPNVLRFDLNQAGGLERCRAGIFADDVMAADTFES